MQLFAFEKIARTEHGASRYLLNVCSKVQEIQCPSCGSDRVYVIEGGKRRRCARCRYTFSPFAGRWLSEVKVSSQKWLWIIKLFELAMPAATIAEETGVSYPTVLKAVDVVRRSIVTPRRHGMACDRLGRRWGELIAVSHNEQRAVQTLSAIPADLVLCTMRLAHGALVLLDRRLTCDMVLWCGSELRLVNRGDGVPHRLVYMDGMEGFWPFAKEQLAKHHSLSDAKLPLYLRELEFRFLHRDLQLFDLLVERLCSFKGGPRTIPRDSD